MVTSTFLRAIQLWVSLAAWLWLQALALLAEAAPQWLLGTLHLLLAVALPPLRQAPAAAAGEGM